MRNKDFSTSHHGSDIDGETGIALPKKGELSRATLPKIVSLFAGAGGMDLGFKAAGYTISVAIDISSAAIASHRHNFATSKAVVGDLIALQPAGVLGIVKDKIPTGSKIAVIGGPPCQGFSRANTKSKACDPRNQLPSLYVEIVKELQKHYEVDFIVMENVLGIRDRKHIGTYNNLISAVKQLGFDVTERELCAVDFGVPQQRRRVIVCGLKEGRGYSSIVFRKRKGLLTVREAISHLPEPMFFKHKLKPSEIPEHPNHWTMTPRSKKFLTPDLFLNDGRSFKKLHWDKASPTVAYGNREIHVHPTGSRRLSIFEAMLLQGFPKGFVLKGNLSEQVEQVSNAVPPPLARSVALAVTRALRGS